MPTTPNTLDQARVEEFIDVTDSASRSFFDEHLIEQVVPRAPGLPERLAAGTRVSDVGCGTGHTIKLLAKAFPSATVGLGTARGAQMAREYLTNAGAGPALAYDAPDDPLDTIFAPHKPESTAS